MRTRNAVRLVVPALILGLAAAAPAAEPDWVGPMQKVHARFKGTPGTFAHFGDSITVSLAYWAPLAGEPKNMSPEMKSALEAVKGHMKPDCWAKWRGPEYGNDGGQTIRWAHQNVDKWLEKLNPEAALIMFGTNDLGQLDVKEYQEKTAAVVDRCLANGTVVILSTIPPRSGKFAEAVRQVAQDKKVPLVDYFEEVVKRRPDDWDGSLPKFKGATDAYQVPTLISGDGVHPSNPKQYQDYSEESLNNNGFALRSSLTLMAYAGVVRQVLRPAPEKEDAVLKAVTLYASFDDAVKADVGGGELTLSTRYNHETEPGKFVFEKGFSDRAFRVAKGKGVAGGALECVDVLPRNGRVFFPAKGNIGFKKGGWGGAVSVWINTDPDRLLKTKFCDPIQITEKGANNGGIWFDFNDASPRDMRHGAFPAVAEGQTPLKEDDPKAPMVRVPKVGFKSGDWHHVVLSWENFDTGKPDAVSRLYVDGRLIGEVKDREIAMNWDVEKAGIYVGVNFIGLLDELAVFGRALTAEEVKRLHDTPGLLSSLKKAAP